MLTKQKYLFCTIMERGRSLLFMPESSIASEVSVLIEQGMAAHEKGDFYEARRHFRRVTELDPENVAGWLGLADAALPYRDKHSYLQRALELEPSNTAIQAKLDDVAHRIAAGKVFAPTKKNAAPAEQAQPATQEDTTTAPDEAIFAVCYNHPDRETGLHCIQCSNPICAECAKPSVVGQLCPDCAKERRPPNYQVSTQHLAIAGGTSAIASFLLSIPVVMFLQGFLFGVLLAIFAGSFFSRLLVNIIDKFTQAKRGKPMQIAAGVGIGLGAIPLLLVTQSLALLVFVVALIVGAVTQLR
jgi:tetratricopeptide (TPR) repeat protein